MADHPGCPKCLEEERTIDDSAPLFTTIRYDCGYTIALMSEISGGEVKVIEPCRRGIWRQRLRNFLNDLMPPRSDIESASVRLLGAWAFKTAAVFAPVTPREWLSGIFSTLAWVLFIWATMQFVGRTEKVLNAWVRKAVYTWLGIPIPKHLKRVEETN